VTRDGRLAGRISLVRLDFWQGQAEVTYWVVPAARGQGVAPRAVQAVAAWAFDLGFHRLELGHSTQNTASCRVADKSGFRLEGTRRDQGLHADSWHDMHLHARLASDLHPR
jgi:RimJ/RimL family protein N-acetyltransferase